MLAAGVADGYSNTDGPYRSNDRSPLVYAAYCTGVKNVALSDKIAMAKRKEIVDLLIDRRGISIDAVFRGSKIPALHAAVKSGQPEMVRHLLEKGANPNVSDVCGNTALSKVSGENAAEIKTLLLKYGARLPSRDKTKGPIRYSEPSPADPSAAGAQKKYSDPSPADSSNRRDATR